MSPPILPTRASVLLLEDSDIDAELLGIHLRRARVALDLTRAARRAEFLSLVGSRPWDLVLADYSLPDFDGLSALRIAREALPEVPFIFVSGVVGEDIATEALRQGATDYVLKRNLGRLTNAVERALAEARERAQRHRAEAALGASEANVRLAVEAAELGMWHYAPPERRFSWDARCQRAFGLDGQAQADDAQVLDRCHPDDRAGLAEALQTALDHGAGARLVWEGRSLDAAGREHWVVLRGELMRDAVRHTTQLLGVLQDVTEQKQAEARQRQTELLFRMAVEATEIGVWELAIGPRQLWLDDGIRRMADLPPDVHPDLAEMLERVVHPEDRARVEQALDRAMAKGGETGIDVETRLVGLVHGRIRWVALKGRRQAGPDGRDLLIGTARDITDQKRQDQALRRANQALEQRVASHVRERDRIWNLSPDLMAVCRPDGTLAAVNPAWESLLGWPAESLLEADLMAFIDPAHAAETRAALVRLGLGPGQADAPAQASVRFDNRLRARDGGLCWIRWTASADNGVIYAIGRDVTAERAAADELAAANRELTAQIAERGRMEATLQQMQRLEAVGQLTAGVAHDFNNLLTVVLSNIGLVRRLLDQGQPVDPRVQQRLDSMRSAAERGAMLTTQLLAFSRRQRLEPQPLDLNDTVLGMRDLLQTTLGGSVRLTTDLGSGLWPALADPTQLELIVLNLAINARDAMEVGGTLTLRTMNLHLAAPPARPEEPEPGDYVCLSVSDTGSGMAPEVLAKAFEPFFTTKGAGRGSGLGLAQVYGFAKQSGGGVRIDTAPGQGTTVHVFMPRARTAPVTAAAVAHAAPALAPPDGGRRRHRLLVVDDDASVREVTASMLVDFGYEVVEADNGPAALAVLRERDDVDLVIADFAMPGMNGAELRRALQRSHPRLPVLFFTGFVDLAALQDVPDDHVLQKPPRNDELRQRLQRLLGPGR